MELSTELLRTFVCVSEEKGFSNAAIKLHKSQSSISTQIKLLEKQLGSKLFDRSEHPPELTEIGRAVLQFAKEFINRTRDLERDLKEFAENEVDLQRVVLVLGAHRHRLGGCVCVRVCVASGRCFGHVRLTTGRRMRR